LIRTLAKLNNFCSVLLLATRANAADVLENDGIILLSIIGNGGNRLVGLRENLKLNKN
jgi:hypothetical protein